MQELNKLKAKLKAGKINARTKQTKCRAKCGFFAEPNADSFTSLEQAEKIEKTRSKQTEIRSINEVT